MGGEREGSDEEERGRLYQDESVVEGGGNERESGAGSDRDGIGTARTHTGHCACSWTRDPPFGSAHHVLCARITQGSIP